MQQTFEKMGLSESVPGANVKRVELTRANENPRLMVLLASHQRLLKQLGLKQRELQRFKDEAEVVRSHLAGRMAPLEDTSKRLDDEMHALFAAILERPKLSKRARRDIEALYIDLQRWGTISPRTIRDEHVPWDYVADEGPASGVGPDSAGPAGGPDVAPQEPHRGRSGDKKNLRTIFLKLAAALHPDKVQDDLEKARRTALMKELNRAYQDGDVARILEIESSLSVEELAPGGDGPEDELERRCRILESQNKLLATQYQEVLNDLWERRRSMLGETVIEVRRGRRARVVDPYRSILEPIEESVESLAAMRDHVDAFAKGTIRLEEFLQGPMDAYEDDEDEDDELCDCPSCTAMREQELLDVLGMLDHFVDLERAKASQNRTKAARKRQKAARKKNRKK